MGYNISEVSGTFTPTTSVLFFPDGWTFDADLTQSFVTIVGGDFDVTIGPSTNGEATDGYEFQLTSGDEWGDLTFNTVTGEFEFTVDRAAVIASGSDQVVTFTVIGRSGGDSDTDTVTINILICVTRGTLIETPQGPVPVEDLRVGDPVVTFDGGAEPIRWIGSRRVTGEELARDPSLRPVRISAGALGPGRPARDLSVSPQHRILLSGWRAELLFGEDTVLAPAKGLLDDHAIRIDREIGDTEYFHLLFDRHEIIFTDGLPTESFFPGRHSIGALEAPAREELMRLFPELGAPQDSPAPAGPGLRPWEARLMASRRLS